MTGWLLRAAKKAGLAGAEDLQVVGGMEVDEAWAKVCAACGIAHEELAKAVADAFSMPVADLDKAAPTATKLVPASTARKHHVYPLRDEDRYLVLATANPVDADAEQELAFVSGRIARFEIASPDAIAEAIESTYAPDAAAESLLSRVAERFDELGSVEVDIGAEEELPEEVSEEETAAGPVVRLTNIILHEAVGRGASDIHIQPMAGSGVVRFRTDGVLQNGMQMPLPVLTRIVSRIKIMAKLDITDRLRPQDGRARIFVDGRKYDLRVSTVPTRNAEKAVVRVLDTQGAGTLVETGIVDAQIQRIRAALSNRDGIVVVTGPTGSGKTTTLYGALREIATPDVNIMTVEDPVEYELPGLTQIQVEHKQGMTFASALRAILRQDPDIIFVGEIRDSETANIAAQASLTGHLVLATLHTNDAVGSIRRFIDLGLDAGTIGETLRGALAQRLVRRACEGCAEEVGEDLTATEQALADRYGRRPKVRAKGCDRCLGSGYLGRLPVTEFMVPTPDLVRLIMDDAPPFELQRQAVADGMTTLAESALGRMEAGQTTIEEVDRVIGLGDSAQNADRAEADAELAPPPERRAPVVDAEAAIADAAAIVEQVAAGNGFAAAPRDDVRAAGAGVPSDAAAAGYGAAARNGAAPPRSGAASPGNGAASPGSGAASGIGTTPSNGAVDHGASVDTPHVLLVDDDGTTRSIARGILEKKLGYRVTESPDGSDAILRLARGETYSLMLLDLDMPQLGGKDVLKSVRQSMATAGLPVVVLTGTPDPDAEIELMEMGADDYLRKPIDPPRLQTRVKAALRRAQG